MKINNWNIVTVKLPSGEEITVGFNDKEGVLRIRKPGWIPLEITPAEIEGGEIVSILPDGWVLREPMGSRITKLGITH